MNISGTLFGFILSGLLASTLDSRPALASAPDHVEHPLTPVSKLSSGIRSEISTLLDSSFHFRLQPGVDCTGTFISDQGHFLTALHCVAGCLAKHHAILRSHASEDPTKIVRGHAVYTDLMTINEDRLDEGITCPITIGSEKSVAKVVLTGGKGWLFPKDTLVDFAKHNADDYKKLTNDGYEHGYDFAILQTEMPKTARCVSLAPKVPTWGEPLRTISYACLDRENLQADCKTALYSSGRRTAGFRSSQFYRSRKSASLPFSPEMVERKDTFFSSLDIEKCGSGSGIFDSRNRLVGIATRVYKNSTDYEYGSTEAVDVAQAWRELDAKVSGSEMRAITTCQRASGAARSQSKHFAKD